MSPIDQKVSLAQTRLTCNTILEYLAQGVLIAAGGWALLLLVERTFGLQIPLAPALWLACGVAAVIALVGTALRRIDRLGAAVAVDRSAGLKERLSTAMAVRVSGDPVARLVIQDAEKAAASVRVPQHIPLRAPAIWPWSAAMVAAAALLAALMPQLNLLASERRDDEPQQQAVAVERDNVSVAVNRQLEQVKQLAQSNPALAQLAAEIDPLQLPQEPTATPDDIRREAVRKIDKVSEQLAAQKESLQTDALRQLKRDLLRLDPQQSPDRSSELAKSLASGDFSGARKELEKMKNALEEAGKSGNQDAKAQLSEMQKKLEDLARQLAKLQEENKQTAQELAQQANLSEEDARKLLEQLAKMDPKQLEKELQKALGQSGMSEKDIKQLAEKLAARQQAMQQCQGLGKCMAQAAQALQKAGQAGGAGAAEASAALAEAMGQLSDMEMAEQMMNDLQAQLAELRNLREGVCKGGFCRKPGGQVSDQIGNQGPNEGLGYGSRIGKEKGAHDFRPDKVRSPQHAGEIIGQMLIDGPQTRGEASAEARDTVNSAVRDASDAIERQDVPRQYERVLRLYFESLAGLVQEPSKAVQPAVTDGAKPAVKP
jgi:glycerol-3-phosphate cytidylyltransferase-like family protein